MRKSGSPGSLKEVRNTLSIGRLRSCDYELESWLLEDFKYMQSALFSLPIKPSAILGLEFIAEFYREHGTMNPSYASIGRYAKLKSHKAIKNMLYSLEQEGFLLIADNFDLVPAVESGRRTIYSYTLTKNIRYYYEIYLIRKRNIEIDKYLSQWFLTERQREACEAEKKQLAMQKETLEASMEALKVKLQYLKKPKL